MGQRFSRSSVEGLLNAWLTDGDRVKEVEVDIRTDESYFNVPCVRPDERWTIGRVGLRLDPSLRPPLLRVDDDCHVEVVSPGGQDGDIKPWEPAAATVSRRGASSSSVPCFFLPDGLFWERDGKTVAFAWENVDINVLFGMGGNPEVLRAHKNMKKVADLSGSNFERAVELAWEHADRYVSTGGKETRIAWGAVGLFWALLIDRVERSGNTLRCQRCGRYIEGRSDKKFCHEKDDHRCYEQRRTEDRNRQRKAKRSGKVKTTGKKKPTAKRKPKSAGKQRR